MDAGQVEAVEVEAFTAVDMGAGLAAGESCKRGLYIGSRLGGQRVGVRTAVGIVRVGRGTA